MTDKLREEIKEYWHQLHHYSLSTRVDKIMEIIERERKAAIKKALRQVCINISEEWEIDK